MIKVCSLDFLKKEKFETDILTVDGSLLCAKDEKVTPELILRLYFKETYVSEVVNQQTHKAMVSADDEIMQHLASLKPGMAEEGSLVDQLKSTTSDSSDGYVVDGLTFAKSDLGEELTAEELASGEKPDSAQDLTAEALASKKKSDIGEELTTEELALRKKSDLVEELVSKVKSGSSEELTAEELESRAKSGSEEGQDHEKSSPRKADSLAESILGATSGPKADSKEALEAAEAAVKAALKLAKVTNEFSDLDKKLEFNEEEAKRISEYSVLMGKALNFSEKRLKELEQAAYYCNIGRTKFTVGDLRDKDFQKKQAHVGYDIVLNEKKLSERIAEAVKFCVVNYDSSAFKLGGDIPYYHILQIANFYEKQLQKNSTNKEALARMLQIGGNRFNIFVLHKFINIMRKTNG